MTGARTPTSHLGYRHQKVQRLRRLLRRRALRDAEGAFVAEGPKLLEEALAAGAEVESVFITPGADHPSIAHAATAGVRVHVLEPGVMERVADTVTPQEVVAVVRTRTAALDDLRSAAAVVVLVDVRDPGNAGTILRSAEAAGVDGVILCDGSVDVWNPKTVRSSAGSVFHVPIVAGGAPLDVVEALRSWGTAVLGTTMLGGEVYDQADLRRPVALVFGNEANGLPEPVLQGLDGLLSIPIAGRSESLNVSMAASVLCFEVARQRRVG